MSWGTGSLAGYQFTYDDASRISNITSYLDFDSYFGYDDTDQLTSVDHASQGDESYAYDANGNRLSDTIGANNQLLYDSAGNSYTYDAEENRVTKTDAWGHLTTYEYDHRNRLVGASGWLGGPYPEDTGEGTGWGSSNPSGSMTVGPALGAVTSWGWGSSSGTAYSGPYAVDASVAAATEGSAIVVTLTSNTSDPLYVNYAVAGFSALSFNNEDFYVIGGNGGTVTVPAFGTGFLYINTQDDAYYENTESVAIWLDINGDPSSQIVLEGDIYDNDATSPQSVSFSASAAAVVEGDWGTVWVTGQPGTRFEFWAADVSADGSDYYPITPGWSWILGSGSTSFGVSFATYGRGKGVRNQ